MVESMMDERIGIGGAKARVRMVGEMSIFI